MTNNTEELPCYSPHHLRRRLSRRLAGVAQLALVVSLPLLLLVALWAVVQRDADTPPAAPASTPTPAPEAPIPP